MAEATLHGRRVLITAGPTWVKIDAVRHIGNVSSGRTGLVIARAAAARGAGVTLLLGPGRACPTEADRRSLRILPYVTFDDLHEAVRQYVSSRAYDVLIHAAAVSDYRPVSEERGKLSSGQEELVLHLRPTPKIVDEVKALDPTIVLVKFKLEVERTDAALLEIAQASRARSDADLMVANDLSGISAEGHRAFLLDRSGEVARAGTTAELAEVLMPEIARRLRDRPYRTVLPPGGPSLPA
jgi:phosphopantothenoylcysteine decarboxylase/phosphopantothenate--cysteine ligase